MVRLTDCPDITIAVDWDVKNQIKTEYILAQHILTAQGKIFDHIMLPLGVIYFIAMYMY